MCRKNFIPFFFFSISHTTGCFSPCFWLLNTLCILKYNFVVCHVPSGLWNMNDRWNTIRWASSCVMNWKKAFWCIEKFWKQLSGKNKTRIHLATLYLLSDTGEKEKAARKNISYVITYCSTIFRNYWMFSVFWNNWCNVFWQRMYWNHSLKEIKRVALTYVYYTENWDCCFFKMLPYQNMYKYSCGFFLI